MTITRCGQCNRHYHGAGGWNVTVRAYGQDDHGRLIGWVRQ